MITFAQFSERLARGQLKNTAAVDDTNLGEICPEYEDTILSLTNQGLVDLSTRFPLITKQIDLTFVDSQYVYQLVQSNVGVFLDDAYTDVFEDNFVRVLDIWDADGKRHPHDTNGHIMTPVYNSLRFSASKMEELGEKVRIRYQSKHAGIDADANIDIPPNLETALQLFVASLYISHMNGPDHSAKGDSYFAAYLRHIGEDEQRNTSSVSEIQEDTRFNDRGFV
tara:strand:- start:204 stop:875 length:672 start_codon:yes stop_codon:yes gene_type:complete